MTTEAGYTLGILGFGIAEQTLLDLYFASHAQTGFRLDQPARADALLVDMSAAEGCRQYQQLVQKFPACAELPGLAVAAENESLPQGFLLLQRPLTLRQLTTQLDALVKNMSRIEVDSAIPSEHQRNAAFSEWQTRKLASLSAMKTWGQAKQASAAQKTPFALHRPDFQEVISKANLVLAHRQQQTIQSLLSDKSADNSVNKATHAGVARQPEISPQNLSNCIDQAFNQVLVTDCCGYLADQDLTDPRGLRRVCFSLDQSLLPWLVKAVQMGQQSHAAQQITGLPGLLVYLPERDSFYCDLEASLLLHMARARFGVGELFLQPSDFTPGQTQDVHGFIFAAPLIWKLALLTSRGRFPDCLDIYKPIQLLRKPNFSILEPTPQAKMLAELWYKKQLSPVQLLAESGIPQRYVFTFLVAADAVGYFKPY